MAADSSTVDTNSELRPIYWDAGNNTTIPGGFGAAALAASLRGDDFFVGYSHEDASSDKLDVATNATVLNSSDHYLTLTSDEVAVVTQIQFGLSSINDVAHIEIGRWSGTNASDFVAETYEYDAHTGAALSANDVDNLTLDPPVVVKASEDTKVGFRIERNDATAEAMASMRGFKIKDLSFITSS